MDENRTINLAKAPIKYCQHCGAEMEASAMVCPKCGTPVAASQPQVVVNNIVTQPADNYPYKSKVVALLLCFFLGGLGIHRFYVGKIGTGLIWLVTGGLFLIGWVIDFISILIGGFRDKANMPLK